MWFNGVSVYLVLGLILGLFAHAPVSASEGVEFIWSNERGLVSSADCPIKTEFDIPFHISKASDGEVFENLRPFNESPDSDQKYKVVNLSMIKLIDEKERKNYESVQVVGVHEAPGVDLAGRVAQRNYMGYLYEPSILPLKDFIIQITKAPDLNDGKKFDQIPGANFGLVKGFLEVVFDNNKYVTFECDEKSYVAFDLHVAGKSGPVARIGVHDDETSIFRHMRTYTNQEAEATIAAEVPSERTSTTETEPVRSNDYMSVLDRVSSTFRTPPKDEIVHEEEVEEAEEDDGIDYSKIDEEPVKREVIPPVPVVLGNLEYRVCMGGGYFLNVRGLTDSGEIDMGKELFRARQYSVAKPVQSFNGPNVKFQMVGETKMEFVLMQFPDVEGTNTGWVAKEHIELSSHCGGYQKSLGKSQPIVCVEGGDLNVYAEDKSGALVKKDFRASQFEEVAYESEAVARPRQHNGLEYIGVVFLNRNYEAGWVAKKYIKSKDSCEPFKNKESEPFSHIDGPLFPSPGRPTASYVKGGPGAGKKWFGARRDDDRLHGACDLFRPFKDKVQSIGEGTIIRGPYLYFSGTFAVEVRTHTGKVVRYGETTSKLETKSKELKKGDVITRVGRNNSKARSSMLHFELYSGSATGKLTTGSGKYKRRSDLMDPTSGLRSWEKARFGKSY